jgi:hypothetical protein
MPRVVKKVKFVLECSCSVCGQEMERILSTAERDALLRCAQEKDYDSTLLDEFSVCSDCAVMELYTK